MTKFISRADTAELLTLPGGGAFHLLADASHTGGALGANRLVLGVGAAGAKAHYHAKSTEVFYVLDGVAEFILGDEPTRASRGDLVVVPPGLPHAFGAAPGHPADLLVLLTPGVERFDYFRQLAGVKHGEAAETYDVHPVSSG